MKKNVCKIVFSAVVMLLPLGLYAQTIIRFAGDTTIGYFGDGGQATAAKMNQPEGLAIDGAGNVYIGEGNGSKIRKVTLSGIISTIAGNSGVTGYSGDHGPATAATFVGIEAMAFDGSGNLYVADFANSVIRKIDGSGIITTVVGTGTAGYFGDGGPATAAKLNYVMGLTFDPAGNMYISDWKNYVIRKVDLSGNISTFAGSNVSGYSGDGFAATAAKIGFPYRCKCDAAGNLYFVDNTNNCVRKVDASGIITTVVGDGTGLSGFAGDGAAATTARLSSPTGLVFDVSGNLYISDRGNDRVRRVSATTGKISTVVGTGLSFETGDGGPATAANINKPFDLLIDANGNGYIADINGNTVREVVNFPTAAFAGPAGVCVDSCVNLNGTSTGNVDTVNWSIPGVTISNPHLKNINACFPTPGTYPVTLYVQNISGSSTHTSNVVVYPVPHPHVTTTGFVNFSVPNVYSSYTWYKNGFPDATGTTNTYTGSDIGMYYVIVDSAGCPGISDTGYIMELVPTLNNPKNEFWLSQTNSSTLQLLATQSLDKELTVNIFDFTGRKLLSEVWNAGTNSKQISGLSFARGLYIVRLSNRNTSSVLKWEKE